MYSSGQVNNQGLCARFYEMLAPPHQPNPPTAMRRRSHPLRKHPHHPRSQTPSPSPSPSLSTAPSPAVQYRQQRRFHFLRTHLCTHGPDFSADELTINPHMFPGVRRGDIVEIYSAAPASSSSSLSSASSPPASPTPAPASADQHHRTRDRGAGVDGDASKGGEKGRAAAKSTSGSGSSSHGRDSAALSPAQCGVDDSVIARVSAVRAVRGVQYCSLSRAIADLYMQQWQGEDTAAATAEEEADEYGGSGGGSNPQYQHRFSKHHADHQQQHQHHSSETDTGAGTGTDAPTPSPDMAPTQASNTNTNTSPVMTSSSSPSSSSSTSSTSPAVSSAVTAVSAMDNTAPVLHHQQQQQPAAGSLSQICLRVVDPDDTRDMRHIALEYVELTFKDQYFSRSDMWRFTLHLQDTTAYVGKVVEWQGMRATVREMSFRTADGMILPRKSGYIDHRCKFTFRSRSANIYMLFQMSREMWQYDHCGGDIHITPRDPATQRSSSASSASASSAPSSPPPTATNGQRMTGGSTDKRHNWNNIFFEKAVDGFMSELFERWHKSGVQHNLNIILFSRHFVSSSTTKQQQQQTDMRNETKQTSPPSTQSNDSDAVDNADMNIEDKDMPMTAKYNSMTLIKDGRKRKYFDFYKLLNLDDIAQQNFLYQQQQRHHGQEGVYNTQEDGSMDNNNINSTTSPSTQKQTQDQESERQSWRNILNLLKKEFMQYRDNIRRYFLERYQKQQRLLDPRKQNITYNLVNSTASDGNFLEASNLVLQRYDQHHINRDLRRTGQLIVLVTAGVGVYNIRQSLLLSSITKKRLMDNGIAIDLISLGEPPLHAVPIFRYIRSSVGGAGKKREDAPAGIARTDADDEFETEKPLKQNILTQKQQQRLPPPPQAEFVWYRTPDWLYISFYHSSTAVSMRMKQQNDTHGSKRGDTSKSFIPTCRMPSVQQGVGPVVKRRDKIEQNQTDYAIQYLQHRMNGHIYMQMDTSQPHLYPSQSITGGSSSGHGLRRRDMSGTLSSTESDINGTTPGTSPFSTTSTGTGTSTTGALSTYTFTTNISDDKFKYIHLEDVKQIKEDEVQMNDTASVLNEDVLRKKSRGSAVDVSGEYFKHHSLTTTNVFTGMSPTLTTTTTTTTAAGATTKTMTTTTTTTPNIGAPSTFNSQMFSAIAGIDNAIIDFEGHDELVFSELSTSYDTNASDEREMQQQSDSVSKKDKHTKQSQTRLKQQVERRPVVHSRSHDNFVTNRTTPAVDVAMPSEVRTNSGSVQPSLPLSDTVSGQSFDGSRVHASYLNQGSASIAHDAIGKTANADGDASFLMRLFNPFNFDRSSEATYKPVFPSLNQQQQQHQQYASKSSEGTTSHYRRWSHLYPNKYFDAKQQQKQQQQLYNYQDELISSTFLKPNWLSLVEPATLPLTSAFWPDEAKLKAQYSTYSWNLMPNNESNILTGGNMLPLDIDVLLRELICQRLHQGFQLHLVAASDDRLPVERIHHYSTGHPQATGSIDVRDLILHGKLNVFNTNRTNASSGVDTTNAVEGNVSNLARRPVVKNVGRGRGGNVKRVPLRRRRRGGAAVTGIDAHVEKSISMGDVNATTSKSPHTPSVLAMSGTHSGQTSPTTSDTISSMSNPIRTYGHRRERDTVLSLSSSIGFASGDKDLAGKNAANTVKTFLLSTSNQYHMISFNANSKSVIPVGMKEQTAEPMGGDDSEFERKGITVTRFVPRNQSAQSQQWAQSPMSNMLEKRHETANVNNSNHPVSAENKSYRYQYVLWNQTLNRYEPRTSEFRAEKAYEYNWNYLDHLVSGFNDDMMNSLKFRCIRFHLIPTTSDLVARVQGFKRFRDTIANRSFMKPVPMTGGLGDGSVDDQNLFDVALWGLTESDSAPVWCGEQRTLRMENRKFAQKQKQKQQTETNTNSPMEQKSRKQEATDLVQQMIQQTDRNEWVHFVHKASYHPMEAYCFDIQWLSCNASLVVEFVHSLVRRAKTCDFTMLQTPIMENEDSDPFRICVRLSLRSQENANEVKRRIVSRFNDLEFFPECMPAEKSQRLVHRTGSIVLQHQLRTHSLLWVENKFHLGSGNTIGIGSSSGRCSVCQASNESVGAHINHLCDAVIMRRLFSSVRRIVSDVVN